MFISAIIVAAGSARRFNAQTPKQFCLLDGMPVLAYSLKKFAECSQINEIIIVTSEDYIKYCKTKIVEVYAVKKPIIIVTGGVQRQDSVYNGLCAVSKKTDMVLVHDSARPLIQLTEIEKLIKETVFKSCCVLGVRVKDTIKICNDSNIITHTPNRNFLWQVQTPQAFEYSILTEAYEKAGKDDFYGTDDAMLVERLGYNTFVVEGSYNNIKITEPEDLAIAEGLLTQIKEGKHSYLDIPLNLCNNIQYE